MVSWQLLIPTVALGAATGFVLIAQAEPAQVVEPMDANPMESYQQACRVEARHQGAPEAIAQASCLCLQERVDGLGEQPSSLEDLKAFTEENRLACVFEAILQL